MHPQPDPSLFVEGVRMRPTAEKALAAIAALTGPAGYFRPGVATAVIAGVAGHSEHVVRARLCELRRLGLIESGRCRMSADPGDPSRHYGHTLTEEGLRRIPSCAAAPTEVERLADPAP